MVNLKKYLRDFSSNDFLSDIKMVERLEEKLGIVHDDSDNFVSLLMPEGI